MDCNKNNKQGILRELMQQLQEYALYDPLKQRPASSVKCDPKVSETYPTLSHSNSHTVAVNSLTKETEVAEAVVLSLRR